jgi:hypothetical protein
MSASEYVNITTNSSHYDDYAYTYCDLNPVAHFTGRLFHSIRSFKIKIITGLVLPSHQFSVWFYTQSRIAAVPMSHHIGIGS